MEYEITYVSPDNTYVNSGIPRTNFERLRIPVATLIFLEESRTPPKLAKPAYNIEAIEEHLAAAQQASTEQTFGLIAILKKYLRAKRIPDEVLEELDAVCQANGQRWQSAISKILKLLEA